MSYVGIHGLSVSGLICPKLTMKNLIPTHGSGWGHSGFGLWFLSTYCQHDTHYVDIFVEHRLYGDSGPGAHSQGQADKHIQRDRHKQTEADRETDRKTDRDTDRQGQTERRRHEEGGNQATFQYVNLYKLDKTLTVGIEILKYQAELFTDFPL